MKIKTFLMAIAGLVAIVPIAVADFYQSDSQSISQQTSSALTRPKPLPLFQDSVHPDEPTEHTLNRRFSLDDSLRRMEQIDEALTSFRQVTELNQSSLPQDGVTAIAYTDWEAQNLGFHNWVGSVKGTLREQNLEIKQLEMQLAQKQFEDGQITRAQLDEARENYEQARQEFREFWNKFHVAD